MFETPLTPPVFWALVVICGVGTWLLRGVFILTAGAWGVPGWLTRALRYVPPAVLAAIAVPAVMRADVLFTPEWAWAQPLAGMIAAAVAVAFRRLMLTLVVGMVALWTFSALS